MIFNWLAEGFTTILEIIPRTLNILWSALCAPVYFTISVFYNVFIVIAQTNILQTIEIEKIYQRLTMIIVIVMAFYITFEIVKYVVQPDTITDKEKGAGNIAFKSIIVILLIAFVPRIFAIAYDLQGKIINSNVISKVILGVTEKDTTFASSAGSEFSANVFSMFYNLNQEACPLKKDGTLDYDKIGNNKIKQAKCEVGKATVDANLWLLRSGFADIPATAPLGGTLSIFTQNFGLNIFVLVDKDGDGKNDGFEYIIDFSGLLALAVGIFIAWTLITYGVELAKRYFQLIYLQIMAPVAIMGYLSPKKDNTLSKWAKQCLTTYLDLFIRLSIINFILLLMNILHETFFDTETMFNAYMKDLGMILRPDVLTFAYILLIIGLFTFAKKAPKLIGELFPSSGAAAGNYNMFSGIKPAISGVSRAIGGVVGGVSGIKAGLKSEHLMKSGNKKDRFLGAARAGFAGAKTGFSKGGGINKARTAAMSSLHGDENTVLGGGTVVGATFQGNKYAQIAKDYDRSNTSLENVKKGKTNVSNAVKDTKVVATTTGYNQSYTERNIGTADKRTALDKQIQKATRVYSTSDRNEINEQAYVETITSAYNDLFDSEKTKIDNKYNYKLEEINKDKGLTNEEKINRINILEKEYKETINELNDERDEAINTIVSKINDDKADKKHQQINITIEEARKAAADAEYRYYDSNEQQYKTVKLSQIVEIDEHTGIPTIDENSVNSTIINDSTKFAEKIGDIETAANNAQTAMSASDKNKEAKANAEASGKSGK